MTFKQPEVDETIDLHLRTKHMFIANGELYIGTEDDPYRGDAKISLFGHWDDRSTVFDNAIEAGNKCLSVVGIAHLYGQGPVVGMTRLLAPVAEGDTTITLDATDSTDWNVGDEVYLGPTSYNHESGEYFVISAVDSGTITLESAAEHYHYGTSESTAAKYNDVVDIRGEVVNLSRNVKIYGDTTELSTASGYDWGGQVVCGDTIDFDGKTYACNLLFDNVELF